MIEQRSKHYGSPSAKFAILLLMTLDTPAWRALSTAAQALYPWLVNATVNNRPPSRNFHLQHSAAVIQ